MKHANLPEGAEESSVRSLIERHALEVFAAKGYHGASIREIVDAAGAAAPTLYYHFGSKKGLYRHLIAMLVHGMQERVRAARGTPGGVRCQLVALLRAHIAELREQPARVRFLHRVFCGQLHPEDSDADLGPDSAPPAALRELFEDAVRSGELRPAPVELLVNGLIGAMNMYFLRRFLGPPALRLSADGSPPPVAEPEDADQIVDLFLRGALTAPKKES